MAGAGYKLFNTGDVLTAAQVNTYLQEQTVMVFASSAARTSALSGVLAEGMMSYLQDTNAVEVYNGSSWVNVGNAGDITEVQAGVGISIASGTGPIPVITNSSTDLITTAGDILYGTAADTVARLGIGTAGQVLKVNSGATAPEWGAAGGAAALSIIAPTSIANSGGSASASGGEVTFSGVNSVSLNGVFSATYDNYLVWIEANAASGNRTGRLRLRASGSDNTTSNYRSGYIYSGFSGSSVASDNRNNQDYWVGYYLIGTESTAQTLFISSPNLSKFTKFGGTMGINDANAHFSGTFAATTAFDGVTFFPETVDTFTGKIRVYGYANS